MARPIWKGAIAFGLVNIPIQLETAVREKNVSFHLLSKDGGCRLRRKLYCPDTGKEFEYNETARGIEIGDDRYVVVDDKELDRLRPEKGKTIEIEQFADLNEIDPVYFDSVYYVTPTEGSSKAYNLLHEAMRSSGRVALARFVMRERENLAAIRVVGDGIVLHTMHFADEVLDLEEALPSTLARAKPAPKELAVAKQLIDAMTKSLDLSTYKDEYREKVEDLIEKKRAGKKTVKVFDDHDDSELPRTINLMDALKKSLSKKPARAAPRKKSA